MVGIEHPNLPDDAPAGRPLTVRVPPGAVGLRLADWLARRFRYHDAAQWRREVAAGRVRLDGRTAAADDLLGAGAEVAYWPPAPAVDGAVPPLAVLCADAAFLVVDKPAYLAAHAEGAFPANTVVHRLAAQLGLAAPSDLRLAHRLDRETSGALLLARTAVASRAFTAQFAAEAVTKEYLALVAGEVGDAELRIELPLGRAAPGSVRRPIVAVAAKGAQAARTDARVVARLRGATLLAVVPHTGRTHQIRAHLAAVGHPLLGDKLYGRTDADYAAYVAHVKQTGDPRFPGVGGALRHMLHAERLAFAHPSTGVRVDVHAPLPVDFAACLAQAGS